MSTASNFSYSDRQRKCDQEYERNYASWLASLSPAQRAKVERMGLGKADTASRVHGKQVDLDVERMAATTAPQCADESESDEFRMALTVALSEFVHWLVLPPGQCGLNAKAIGQRVIMACWVMRPDIIGNLSLTEIGALVDTWPEVLSRQATAFSKRFGIRGRSQFSEKTRKAQRAAKLKRSAVPARSAASEAVEAAQKPPFDPALN